MKYEKKSEWGEDRTLWPICLPEIKAWQWRSKITQKQMPSFLFLCNFAWFLYFLSYILSGILDLSATMDPEINEWNENCWISLAISNLKWIGCFLRSTEKKNKSTKQQHHYMRQNICIIAFKILVIVTNETKYFGIS